MMDSQSTGTNEQSMGAKSGTAASLSPLGYRDMEVVVDGVKIPVR